jgi:hypothetical protein
MTNYRRAAPGCASVPTMGADSLMLQRRGQVRGSGVEWMARVLNIDSPATHAGRTEYDSARKFPRTRYQAVQALTAAGPDSPAAKVRSGAGVHSRTPAPPLIRARQEKPVIFGTILLIVLTLLLMCTIPSWSHSRDWGYGPSGGLGLAVVLLLLLMGKL